ncbi:MAG: hypothetical protein GYA57_18875, partial [Myxococcales bacterium]|nr:hypothetical protein [Myxococcales bacterium]
PDAFRPSTYECRAAAPGGCDVPENCTGTSATCPPDAFRPSTYECRAAATGGCDVPENCTGTSAVCPSDVFRPPSYECRPAAPGGCDVPENCTGTSAVCPSDARLPDGARCAFCRTCAAGTCTGFAALGADPGSDCPAIECDRYIYGWSGNSCVRYAASTAYNGGCNGAGACASVVQSCQGAGTSIHAGTCASAGCRNRTESSPCYPGASAPSAFGGACDYAGGPCFCDEDMHECVDPGDVCNPPAGSCGPPI